MFDVGFSELVVIGVVALIVIGPERLPAVARTAGVLLARLQRYVNGVKADINREIQLDELKKLQENLAEQTRAIEASVNAEMQAVETSVSSEMQAVEATLQELHQPYVAPPVAEAAPPAAETPTQQMELGLGPAPHKNI